MNSTPEMTAGTRPTPLAPMLALSFLASLGTGVVNNGIFFLTRNGYGFSDLQNYLLAVLIGAVYIAGALGASSVTSTLRRVLGSTRAVLGLVLVLLSAACAIAPVADLLPGGRAGNPWAIWTAALVYSPLTGVLWPLIESYASGGRQGPHLASVMGIWNTTWCSALVVAGLALAPLVERQPGAALLGLGALHVASTVLLRWFGAEPGAHAPDSREPHPRVYSRLLVTFRFLLPCSYVLSSTLIPFLASALSRFDLSPAWQVRMVVVYMLARTLTFAVMGRWQAWHGRWTPPIAGAGAILLGFAVSVLAPRLGPGGIGVGVEVAGLALFGVGMAALYSGAVYYALEVGRAEVDAGGKHEALIGVGYTVGPLCPLAAKLAVDSGALGKDHFEATVLGSAGALCVGVAVLASARSVLEARRTHPADGSRTPDII